jgi:hypothetical protein
MSARGRLAAYLLSVLAAAIAAFALVTPRQHGDVAEYTLMTLALANHGTPDIRLSDIADGKRMLPGLAGLYGLLERDMAANKEEVFPAFARGRHGDVYANHFFAYSALAVVPFKLLQAAGRDPFGCYLALNLAALCALAYWLYRFFGSPWRAWAALLLMVACGSALYLPWTSTETASAALLLAALCAFTLQSPFAAALMAALAAQQNPTILLFFGFAPLLRMALTGERAGHVLERRTLAALLLGAALCALPVLFNLWQFGVPSVIARTFSSSRLVGLTRLGSFFFDLNQGMLVGVPALALALLAWGWRRGAQAWRDGTALLLALVFIVAMCLPALAIWNFNSGAAGMMRYAVWSAMPLLFVLLWRMRRTARWPWGMLAVVLPLQASAMWHANSYGYKEFSPLAQAVMRAAPALYWPEPEVFGERAVNGDDYIDPAQVYRWPSEGEARKQMYNEAWPGIHERLCGQGREPKLGSAHASYRSWRFIDGPLECIAADPRTRRFVAVDFAAASVVQAGAGWVPGGAPSMLPVAGTGPDCLGLRSEGMVSELAVVLPAGGPYRTLALAGVYASKNNYTRIGMDGRDLGRHQLDQLAVLPLPDGAAGGRRVTLRLEHERDRAFCLQQVVLR